VLAITDSSIRGFTLTSFEAAKQISPFTSLFAVISFIFTLFIVIYSLLSAG